MNGSSPPKVGNATVKRGRAQSTVEFALILWPFLLLLFATCDYAQLYFYENALRHALRESGRFATPGKVLGTNSVSATITNVPDKSMVQPSKWISRNESIKRVFSNACVVMFTPADMTSKIRITSWPGTNSATETNSNVGPGMAEDFMKIKVTYNIQLITPVASVLWNQSQYPVIVEGIFRNEPSNNFDLYTNYHTGSETP
jgi:Flp pilus assembly protein TadG